MKSIRMNLALLIILSLLIPISSCHKDSNSYAYSDAEKIIIEGLESSYSVVAQKDRLKIKPVVTSNIPDYEFEYSWAIYPQSGGSMDTIAHTKDIDLLVTWPAKQYHLVYIVKNRVTGLSKYNRLSLSVNTEYTRGWYVFKDNGVTSDLDQFLTTSSIIPDGGLNEDVFSKVNGFRLEGKAFRMTYVTDYKTMVESEDFTATRTLFLGTDKNVASVFINTLGQMRDKKEIFFAGEPTFTKNMRVFLGSSAIYLMNDGKVHGIINNSANSGYFGPHLMRDDQDSPYELSPYFFGSSRAHPYLFDNKSSSFLVSVQSGTVLTKVANSSGSNLSATNNNMIALYLGCQNRVYNSTTYLSTFTGWGILQDKSNPEIKLLAKLEHTHNTYSLKIETETIRPTDKLYSSTKHSLLSEAENYMYFVYNDGNVYSRNLSNGAERLQFSVPAGEEVSFIKHNKSTAAGYAFDYVIIGTNNSGNYTVRMFEKSAGNLLSQPKFTLQGKGNVADVMYISPSILNDTYPTDR